MGHKAGHDDEVAPVVEMRTAVYLSSQQGGSRGNSSDYAEKQTLSQRPELKRKLKSRHLQMIAIGTSRHIP
jgi:amino acid permease